MYYSGIPFNEYSELKTTNATERYFYKRDEIRSFCSALYEGVLQNEIDVVIYQEAKLDDERLISYHKENYQDIAFQLECKLEESVYKIISVVDKKITGYQIIKYDKFWRIELEHIFDEKHLLLEYRKLFYENETKRIPQKEKVFFSSWHISEEEYL
ncbi:hypothetical protein [Flavobacterium oreochromis]|uniref:hypothetical protein n=1 Tax=Flavobacterium oreochromis TaxID=2906078 RepID=UPI00385862B7